MVEIERSSVCDLVFMDVYWEWHTPLSTLPSFLGNFSGKKKGCHGFLTGL
jgi:hypothetical protein